MSEIDPEITGLPQESNPRFSVTRKQRIALASAYYVARLSPLNVVWNQDAADWLKAGDSATAIAQPTLLVMYNRFADRGVFTTLWEQFDTVVRRPPRKYHLLTTFGTKVAIQSIQELRADPKRPSWIAIPELHDGQYEPFHPEGFEVSPPKGLLVPLPSEG